METNREKVMIIGAGPAGIAAAIYLARAGIGFVIFEGGESGGLLRNAFLVENYPGFPGGIRGASLASLMTRQMSDLGIGVTREMVKKFEHDGKMFRAETSERIYESEIAVIASGTVAVEPDGIEISPDASGRVFREVVEAAGTKEKRFAVIGGGDAAFDYALSLAERNDVAIFLRASEPRCLGLLADRCVKHEKIDIYAGTEILEIDACAGGIVLTGRNHGENEKDKGSVSISVEADYALIATGRRPCLDFVDPAAAGQFDLLLSSGTLYLAGDVAAGRYRQTAIAVGKGVEAAMRIVEMFPEERG